MKFILMNKNTKVALVEYNTIYNAIENIYNLYNIDYAPLSVQNAVNDKTKNVTDI